MKKTYLYTLIAATGIAIILPGVASAAITGLNPASSVMGCINGAGSYPSCSSGSTVTSGSYFAFTDTGTVLPGDKSPVTELSTINFNNTTAATGSHSGNINGTESPVFDIWDNYLGSTGMDYLTSPIVDNGNGTLDFSGWTATWNGIAAIPLGGDSTQGDTGLADITCSACNVGDAFSLDYTAHVPLNDPSGFGGLVYSLHLEGTVASVSGVPIPAAAWLFGSGLLGMVALARRRKAAD